MSRFSYGLAAAAVLAALGAGGWFWSQWPARPAPQSVAPPAAAVKPPVAVRVEPAIKHPIESVVSGNLPSLVESDTFVSAALTDLLGRKAVLSLLQTDGFVRRVVATVDNLTRAHVAPRLWPVNPAAGRFAVDANNTVKPNNDERYTPFVLLVESVDPASMVALYVRLYPLFQSAYEELGFPGMYFNDRLVQVIDHLLATPVPNGPLKVELTEVKGELKSQRPWVRYQFSDPALHALSGGQKILLRMGAVNQRRLKARLSALRQHVTRSAVGAKP